MILIYSDESGINYSLVDNFFEDGPFIIRSGLCIYDNKYFHLERMFIDLIDHYFKIDDWLKQEIHAADIWNLQDYFKDFTKERVKDFFEELLQLIIKLDIHCVFGVRNKTLNASNDIKKLEVSKANFAFLHGSEYYLAQSNETGIIIADVMGGEQGIFDKLLFDRINWRINPKAKIEYTIEPKYKFESKSCCLLDQIHYVNSNSSIFIQVVDVINYVMMRVFAYDFLLNFPSTRKADLEKVPISKDTFHFFIQQVARICNYNDQDRDVYFQPCEAIVMHTNSFFHKEFIISLAT